MEREQIHLTDSEIERFSQRAMTAVERRRLDAHVNVCEDCLQRIVNPAHSGLAFASLREAFLPSADEEPFHLSSEELKRYVAEDLDEADRIVFESHLEICSRCNREADDLQAATKSIPVNQPGSKGLESEAQPRWGWLPSFGGRPVFWTPARVFGALAIAGCVLLVLLVVWNQKKPTELVNQATPSQNTTPSPAPTGELAKQTVNNSNSNEAQDKVQANPTAPERDVAASSIAVRLRDGERELSLDGQGNLTGAEGLAPPVQRAIQAALASEGLPKPQALSEVSAPEINLMGQSADRLPFKLISPVGVILGSNRPTLRWQPLGGATSYKVSVFDANFNRVATSGQQAATAWTVPLSLANGKVYSWEVTALKDNQEITSPVAPAPRAQFKVLEAEKLKEIAEVRRRRPTAHFTLGLLSARAGLLDEAEREFQQLLKDNPQSNVAKKLLQTVRSWRNR
jgi:hypothetical protein